MAHCLHEADSSVTNRCYGNAEASVANRCYGAAILLLAMAPLLAAAAPATAPATKPALTDNITDAKGLDYAIDKLKAPMRETDPLSAADEFKQFKPRAGLA